MGIEAPALTPGLSSNLMRFAEIFVLAQRAPAFLREPSKNIELPRSCQPKIHIPINNSRSANFQTATGAHHAPEPIRLARALAPRSCNGLFSVGFPTGAWSACSIRPNEPLLPHPLPGRPQGHREAPLLNYELPKSSIGGPPGQLPSYRAATTPCHFRENTNCQSRRQARPPCGNPRFLWENQRLPAFCEMRTFERARLQS